VTLCLMMEADRCRALLVEASMLITATRSCIARSMSLLAHVSLDGVRCSGNEAALPARVRNSSHPPSTPPL